VSDQFTCRVSYLHSQQLEVNTFLHLAFPVESYFLFLKKKSTQVCI
jgi:hypothetical protein